MSNGERIVFFSFNLALLDQKEREMSSATATRKKSESGRRRTNSCFPSSKVISFEESFHVESMLRTCRISELDPLMSWSTTLAGILSFSLKKSRGGEGQEGKPRRWKG